MWYQEILTDPLMQVLLFLIIMALGWIILRWIFKIAVRIFVIGCLSIFVIGSVLFILNFVSQ